jgi:hypothetical protein
MSLAIGVAALAFQFFVPASVVANPPLLTIEQEFNATFFPGNPSPPPVPTTPPPSGSPPTIQQEYEEWLAFVLAYNL